MMRLNTNMHTFCTRSVVLLAVAILPVSAARADIRLPSLVSNNMVLQQESEVTIWGWADVGEEISLHVGWSSRALAVKADADGKWAFKAATPKAGGPYEIMLTGKNTVTVTNVLVGEVWVCSGQSNMWRSLEQFATASEMSAAGNPSIRLFTVTQRFATEPQEDCVGAWSPCTPEMASQFSAVGYYFGRDIHRRLGVPIGLIHTSYGGSTAEAWMSSDQLRADPNFEPILRRYEQAVKEYPQARSRYESQVREWEQAAETAAVSGKAAPRKPRPPFGPGHPHAPCELYNGMVAPLTPFRVRGVVWYQGEANASRAYQYRTLFPTMIQSWRRHWEQSDLPFLFVQLPNFRQAKHDPGESDWAELREAQLRALALARTGVAVTIDIGDPNNIHPKNKVDVGKRLALCALGTVYGESIVYSGPIYRGMTIDANHVVVHFDYSDGGLVAKGGDPVKGFAIAGPDHHFVWADARIKGDTVVVSSRDIDHPVAVRYGWADNPVCNLYNKAGLPAAPFRTDTWPGVTTNRK